MNEFAAATERIHHELSSLSRRLRAAVQSAQSELTYAEYTMLDRIDESDGCRASELVSFFELEKSTVSRQVSALEARGLVRRAADPSDARAQTVQVTAHGAAVIANAREHLREAVSERLQGWRADEVEVFAALLARYNSARREP